jgi:hypothetical protein
MSQMSLVRFAVRPQTSHKKPIDEVTLRHNLYA